MNESLADAYEVLRDHEKSIEIVRMVPQDVIHSIGYCRHRVQGAKSEQDHARVRLKIDKD